MHNFDLPSHSQALVLKMLSQIHVLTDPTQSLQYVEGESEWGGRRSSSLTLCSAVR